MTVSTLKLHPEGPAFSRLVFGAWRAAEWNLAPADLLGLVEAGVDLGITTVDHADIYGDYTCEARFGEALALKPALRERLPAPRHAGAGGRRAIAVSDPHLEESVTARVRRE